jgi:hypothetical protein
VKTKLLSHCCKSYKIIFMDIEMPICIYKFNIQLTFFIRYKIFINKHIYNKTYVFSFFHLLINFIGNGYQATE